jgi:hypothetical protein
LAQDRPCPLSNIRPVAGRALDFMFWPSPERTYGWFLEPSYSCSFSKEHEQSLGVSVGLLIAIP